MGDVMTYYGGSILAMKGRYSALIISDKRIGLGSITNNMDHTRITAYNNTVVGFTGFLPDAQQMHRRILKNVNFYGYDRALTCQETASMISYVLYQQRMYGFAAEPVIAGFDKQTGPYVCAADTIGAKNEGCFVANGTATVNLLGMAEALYEEGMSDEELFICGVQTFLNAIDRDCLSGWGADVFIINESGVTKRNVKSRMD